MKILLEALAGKIKPIIPFVTVGYPDKESTLRIIEAATDSGVRLMELGMPFTDPLADGPVIQKSSMTAIENGVNLPWILEITREATAKYDIQIILMGYINPIMKYGIIEFIEAAASAGVAGLIIPDLPPEEGDQLYSAAISHGISPIYLIAPNTSPARVAELGKLAPSFLYAVATMGVTGGGNARDDGIITYLEAIRSATETPFVVGFGIKSTADVARLMPHADGLVIGSALIQALEGSVDVGKTTREFLTPLIEAAGQLH